MGEKICPGTLRCKEIDAIGEQPFRDEIEFNFAVWKHCEKCSAYGEEE